ncbi:hypothetical protein VitviT2T_018831 [Vitis vinifera]|uniref:Uncharacterized protein n=3 Tax=Vitis vinifera TaxID=29760 RepID=A0ABY9D132_VITVI|nr:uncharacterized protein At5g08430 [Vitis vinifera]XP_019079162.1 uncharacterized protein At5g08430 [Vitis vinifera]WKA00482.1 hypothetical protein VitviT2T_018831 [Vitis vinifera]|eukprot:XP_010657936.1 PREDICTED: uncharacterized protein At5g08430 [Vitis vinifera]
MDSAQEHKQVSKGKGVMESNLTSTKREFIGWGSKVLMEFLASIGEDTTKKLSKDEVTSIINRYIHENNLFDQKNKMKVLIDERLLPVLGRKSVNRYRINNIVDIHLAENLDQSEQDESGFGSKDKSENVIVTYRRQRKLSSNKPLIKELVRGILQSQFAAIVPKNLKLVFLKRSLVLELLKQPDSFQRKIRGSFVKVKSGAHLYSHHLSYQLFQVIGVKKASKTGEIDSEILLQAPLAKDIHIDMLVEHDLTKEECEEYRQKVKYGFYKRPTIVEFEEKARSLHEDITKHWIKKELSRLQNLIDRANEKGCRSDFIGYMERKQLLLSPAEQLRLLNEVPEVIPDLEEFDPAAEDSYNDEKHGDKGSLGTIPTYKTLDENMDAKGYLMCVADAAEIMELMDKGEIEQIPEDTNEKKTSSEPECEAWHCLGPLGERPGPFSPALLKIWSELNLGASRYKVWKVGHSPEEAIPLGDALCQLFPEKSKKNLNSI